MSRVAYVDSHNLPHRPAAVHIVGEYGTPVGDGIPRPLTRKSHERYLAHAAAAA